VTSPSDLEDAIVAAVRRGDFETARVLVAEHDRARMDRINETSARLAAESIANFHSDLAYKAPEQLVAGGQGRSGEDVADDAHAWFVAILVAIIVCGFGAVVLFYWRG